MPRWALFPSKCESSRHSATPGALPILILPPALNPAGGGGALGAGFVVGAACCGAAVLVGYALWRRQSGGGSAGDSRSPSGGSGGAVSDRGRSGFSVGGSGPQVGNVLLGLQQGAGCPGWAKRAHVYPNEARRSSLGTVLAGGPGLGSAAGLWLRPGVQVSHFGASWCLRLLSGRFRPPC